MKTEKQIRAKLKKLITAYDESDSSHIDYYLIGMMEILEWVLEDEARGNMYAETH